VLQERRRWGCGGRSGEGQGMVVTPGRVAEGLAGHGFTWFEEPVSSQDLGFRRA